jgi:hypothetical protein
VVYPRGGGGNINISLKATPPLRRYTTALLQDHHPSTHLRHSLPPNSILLLSTAQKRAHPVFCEPIAPLHQNRPALAPFALLYTIASRVLSSDTIDQASGLHVILR